ncbi:MAG: FHA domain-containing protein [Proteobacteria bacterium]|nr:FHA domain-containing protein [Pseudomonadota bacterium]
MSKKKTAAKKKENLASILVIRSSNGEKQTVRLRNNEATIFGRSQGDVIIDDHEISGTHCQIHYSGGMYHVLDMNSTNGTYVNNERVIKSRLKHDDIITLGQSSICFKQVSPDEYPDVKLVKKQIQANDTSSNVFFESPTKPADEKSVTLTINAVYSDGTSDTLTFNQNQIFIGRASTFGKFDQDEKISSKHVKVVINFKGEMFIEDQNSTNGIYINNQKVSGLHQIKTTDVVVIGNTYMQLSTN